MRSNQLSKLIFLVIMVFCASISAESLESLRAKIKSMEACRQSLKHDNCNLQILDSDIRNTLIQLDQLNSARAASSNRAPSNITTQGNIQYFTDSVGEARGEVLRLIGGSLWKLDRSYYGITMEDLIGISIDQKNATFYIDGETYTGRLIKGSVITSSGTLTSVLQKMGDGTVLKLSNGMMLEFSSYDAYNTGWWLPPYPVLIDGGMMNMWNLNKGKKVWIQSVL